MNRKHPDSDALRIHILYVMDLSSQHTRALWLFILYGYRSEWSRSEIFSYSSCFPVSPLICWAWDWDCADDTEAQKLPIPEGIRQLLSVVFVFADHHLCLWFWKWLLVCTKLAVAGGSLFCVPGLVQLHPHPEGHALHSYPDQCVHQHLYHISEDDTPTNTAGVVFRYTILHGFCTHS